MALWCHHSFAWAFSFRVNIPSVWPSSSDCKAVTISCSLVYLHPDTRSIANHEKVIFFIPVRDYFVRKLHNFMNNVNLLQDNTEIQTKLWKKDFVVPQLLIVIKWSPKEPRGIPFHGQDGALKSYTTQDHTGLDGSLLCIQHTLHSWLL